MSQDQLLSITGSDRATAYNTSTKIIRRDDMLFVGWLDAPLDLGGSSRIQLGVCDPQNGKLHQTILLGKGIDNHCGPALALDRDGRMHALVGAHHGSFLYRWSDHPKDPSRWSDPECLGPADTYPSLVADAHGVLHLVHREQGNRWQLWYRRKRPGLSWEAPRALAISPTPGYNHFMQSLSIGPSGALHLIFQFYFSRSGHAIDCQGRAAVYLYSEDEGDTWYNEGNRCDDLPLTFDRASPICSSAQGDIRIGNHVVDAQNRPWFYAAMPNVVGGVLWYRQESGWLGHDLTQALYPLNMHGPRSTALARTLDGQLHFLFAADPHGQETVWFDSRHELFHLVLDEQGSFLDLTQLTTQDPGAAAWIPALEMWNWVRIPSKHDQALWMVYTRGLNAGGIGGDNRNIVRTRVYLRSLPVAGLSLWPKV